MIKKHGIYHSTTEHTFHRTYVFWFQQEDRNSLFMAYLKVALSMFKSTGLWLGFRCELPQGVYSPVMTWNLELDKRACRFYFQPGL